MSLGRKSIFIIFLGLLLGACSQEKVNEVPTVTYVSFEGKTMGTYYKITYRDSLNRVFQDKIDKRLAELLQETSTYIPAAVISQFNAKDSTTVVFHPTAFEGTSPQFRHFLANYHISKEIHQKTNGAFDPTVMPLVNYWKFGYTGHSARESIDSTQVDSLLNLVGFEKVNLTSSHPLTLSKQKGKMEVDFSAVAKGYAVDEIADLLEQEGIAHFLVDIGGEMHSKGVNKKGNVWRIGISLPVEDAAQTDYTTSLALPNTSIATSGNYRRFYEIEGKKYAHTIHPETGYPEINTTLSASVLHADCARADAYATAFMVMGAEEALKIVEKDSSLEAFFIIGNEDGTMSTVFSKGIEKLLP